MKKCLISIILLLVACGPQYVKDPNANVLVTSQYENGPLTIHLPENCRPQLDCSQKTEAQCSIALYEASRKFMKEGEKLANKKLYLSASLEYMQALTRLSEAKIRVNKVKTELNDFIQWKQIENYNLEEKLKRTIKYCEKKVFLLQWKR